MKFAFATMSLLAVVAQAAAANLRSPKSASLLESEVILHGVVGEPSPTDLDIIGQALVTSYNDYYWELGHFMTSYETGVSKSLEQSCGRKCSDDDSKNGLFVSVSTPIKQSCGRTCSDDDSILTTPIKQSCGRTCSDDDASAADKLALEHSVCDKIKSSGSAYLSTANDCSIVFVPMEFESKTVHVKDVEPTANMEAHIVLQGVQNEASDLDLAILSKALVSTYNDAFWDAGYQMVDAVAPYQVSIPQTVGQSCGRKCSDDDHAKNFNKGLFVTLTAPVKQSCGRTCSDDDRVIKQSCGRKCSDDDRVSHDYLETSFCDKIKSSASPNLASSKMCAITVVAN